MTESNIIFRVFLVLLVAETGQMQKKTKWFGKALPLLVAAAFLCAMQAVAMAQAAPPTAQSRPAVEESSPPADTAADAIENRKDLEQAWEDASQNMSALYGKFAMITRGPNGQVDRAAIMRRQQTFMKMQSRIMAGQQLIRSRPGDSLQVLIDMFYPPAGEPVDDGVVESLVKALRDDSWRVREQATRKLKALGTAAWPKLQTYAQDADLEVRVRIEFLLDKGDSELRQRLEQFACAQMVSAMKLEDLLPVARRNFPRLLDDDDSAQAFNTRVRGPLLALLRYSEDAHDRDLLALAKALAKPNRRAMLDSIMQAGTVGQPLINARPQMGQFMAPANPSSFWQQPPPKHDYQGAMDRILDDTKDPLIFARAVSCVEHDGKFMDHMKALRQKMPNKSIARQIDKLLGEAAKKKS